MSKIELLSDIQILQDKKKDAFQSHFAADAFALISASCAVVAWLVLPKALFVLALLWLFREIYFKPTIVKPLPIPALVDGLDADIGPTTEKQRRTCVVTGASGFLAFHLVNYLSETNAYDEIRAVDIIAPKFTQPNVKCIVANICDLPALEKCIRGAGTVFHVASLIDVRETKFRTHRSWNVNVTGGTNVINCCIRFGVERLVYTSSFATVFDINTRPTTWDENSYSHVALEDLPCNYAITKRIAETRVAMANGRGRLRTIALRPTIPFGHNDRLQTQRCAYETVLIHTHDGLNISSFVYAKNFALWEKLAAEKLSEIPEKIAGKAFFIDNGGENQKDGQVTILAFRDGVMKRRTKNPVWATPSIPDWIRALLYVFNACAEWYTAGQGTWDILLCNPAALIYAFADVPFDCSNIAKLLGYKQLYSMEEAYDDIQKILDL